MPLEAWQKVIDVNLTGAFLCAREAARMMRDEQSPGVIVNISSVHEQIAWERFSHYCASKGGMKLFAQSIAKELAPLGIRVVNVAPGAVDTPINKSVLENPQESAQVLAEVPLNRWGHVRDVAQARGLAGERAGRLRDRRDAVRRRRHDAVPALRLSASAPRAQAADHHSTSSNVGRETPRGRICSSSSLSR